MFKQIEKKIILSLLIIFLFTLNINNSNAVRSPSNALDIPVGGFITLYQICPSPIYHINIGTTVGKTGKEPGSGFWSYIPKTTFLYDYGPPKSIGQATLGLAGSHYLPCLSKGTLLTPPVKLGPGGPMINMMGTSPI